MGRDTVLTAASVRARCKPQVWIAAYRPHPRGRILRNADSHARILTCRGTTPDRQL
jgi:hypothetical protein